MTMTDHRSPAEIEREIEEERASLTGTLDELQNRFSIDRMTTEAATSSAARAASLQASSPARSATTRWPSR
jgi:hypothetical protein